MYIKIILILTCIHIYRKIGLPGVFRINFSYKNIMGCMMFTTSMNRPDLYYNLLSYNHKFPVSVITG